jgi:hypothetical protein
MKRAVIAFNKKPCPKCQSKDIREFLESDNVPKEKSTDEPRKFVKGNFDWESFKKAKPKIGDRILYYSAMSEEMFLTFWTSGNEGNILEYQECFFMIVRKP